MQWVEILQLLPPSIELGVIISIVLGIPGILVVYWRYRGWKRDRRAKRRQIVKSIIEQGIDYFTEYLQLYDDLWNRHARIFESEDSELNPVRGEYFRTLIGDSVTLSSDAPTNYPLLYREEWLRSNNEELDFELQPLSNKNIERVRVNSNTPIGRRFLRKFGLNLPYTDQQYVDFFDFMDRGCDVTVWDAPTFDSFSIRRKDSILQFDFVKGDYAYFVEVYQALQKELYYQHVSSPSGRVDQFFSFVSRLLQNVFLLRQGVLPVRRLFQDTLLLREYLVSKNSIDDYSDRPAKVGMNVFTIMKREDGGHSAFLHKRRKQQTEYPGFWHVVPAGTFQPLGKTNITSQYDLGYTVFRELLEEVFALDEAGYEASSARPFEIFEMSVERPKLGYQSVIPGKEILGDSLDFEQWNSDRFDLIPTGLLIDLTSLKPEITFLLYIKDEDAHDILSKYSRHMWEGEIAEYDLKGDKFDGNLFDKLNDILHADEFLPAGAVAVTEGLNWYSENIGD